MHWELFMLQQIMGPPGKLVPGMKTPEHGSPAARDSSCHTAMRKGRLSRARLQQLSDILKTDTHSQ